MAKNAKASKASVPYKPIFGLNVVCKNENEQIKLFDRLKAEGTNAMRW